MHFFVHASCLPPISLQVGFARVQAAFAERSFNVWLGVAEEFGVSASVANELSLGL